MSAGGEGSVAMFTSPLTTGWLVKHLVIGLEITLALALSSSTALA